MQAAWRETRDSFHRALEREEPIARATLRGRMSGCSHRHKNGRPSGAASLVVQVAVVGGRLRGFGKGVGMVRTSLGRRLWGWSQVWRDVV